jgi:hypothetical protein
MSTAQFKAGNTYRTRDGQKVTIDDISVAHPGYMIGRIGNDTALWSWHLNGRINNDGPNSPIDLMPNEIAQSIEDVTPDRLSVVESSLRDVHRQLRTLRGNQSEMIADMVAKLEQIVVRLDGTDRRVAALKEGVNDGGDVLLKHEDRLKGYERALTMIRADIGNLAPFRPKSVDDRISAVEATLARIEDCLTAEIPPMNPPRKSLGWLNVIPQELTNRGTFVVLHPTRAAADMMASMRRVACVEIFEGDGL